MCEITPKYEFKADNMIFTKILDQWKFLIAIQKRKKDFLYFSI